MATRKAFLTIFFFFALVLSYFADSTTLNLGLIFIWTLVFDQLWKNPGENSKSRQVFLLKLTLFSIPIIFLIGGLTSFAPLFLGEGRILQFIMLMTGLFLASIVFVLFLIWPNSLDLQKVIETTGVNIAVSNHIMNSMQNVRKNIALIISTAAIMALFILTSIWISAETAVVLGYSISSLFMAYRLHWNRFQPLDSSGN